MDDGRGKPKPIKHHPSAITPRLMGLTGRAKLPRGSMRVAHFFAAGDGTAPSPLPRAFPMPLSIVKPRVCAPIALVAIGVFFGAVRLFAAPAPASVPASGNPVAA